MLGEVVAERRRGVFRGGCGLGVRRSRNAVHSVLFRVAVFIAAMGMRRRREREYIALRYRLVYVGAIAVLLRFVVMRLNVNEWVTASSGAGSKPSRQSLIALGGSALALERVTHSRSNQVRETELRWELMQRVRVRDHRERIEARGQLRFVEAWKRVAMAGRERRAARRAAVVLTRMETAVGSGRTGKGQRIGEQLSRQEQRERA